VKRGQSFDFFDFLGALANPRSEKEKKSRVFFLFLYFCWPSPTRLAA
jgi:hypothetical protein